MVGTRWGPVDDAVGGSFPAGVTLRRGPAAWILSEDPARLLGGALAWAHSAGIAELHLIVGSEAGLVARRAAAFSSPPHVWRLDGRELAEAAPEALPQETNAPLPPPPLASVLEAARAAGAELVAEHGVLRVEVLGLEVARLESSPGGTDLSIGVGRHDREARRMVHAGLLEDPAALAVELAQVVQDVLARRVAGAPAHPANQIAPERWLRSVVVGAPGLVGADVLYPVSPPVPRPDLRARAVAPAAGAGDDGKDLIVVCSTGVDPELVPAAADVWGTAAGRAETTRLALVLPERDDHPVTRRLASLLSFPAEIRTVPSEWRAARP